MRDFLVLKILRHKETVYDTVYDSPHDTCCSLLTVTAIIKMLCCHLQTQCEENMTINTSFPIHHVYTHDWLCA